MPLTLQETFKHSRLYTGFAPTGEGVSYTKTSIVPMNYESVPGSGDYDSVINLTATRVQTDTLDGYEMKNAGWHFSVQIVDPASSSIQPNTQRPAGTVGFGGLRGKNWFYFRMSDMGYLHWPSANMDSIGGSPDYSGVPTVKAKPRNLGTHPQVDDEVVAVNTVLRWGNILNTPDGGEVSLRWGLKSGKMKEEVVINQAAREWIATNRPAATPVHETWFGFRFEIDGADIPKVWRNGVQKDFDLDDFDDDEGPGIQLTDELDQLIAFMPLDEVFSSRRGGRRPLRKRFYKRGGQTYVMVAAQVEHLEELLPGPLVFDPSMTQEQITVTANDCGQSGYSVFPDNPAVLTTVWTGVGQSLYYYGAPYYSNVSGNYRCGFRFTPNVPKGALFTGEGFSYAHLTIYRDDYYSPYLGGPRFGRPYYSATSYWYADVTTGDQPIFAADRVDSPEPGSNWTDSIAKTTITVVTDPGAGEAFPLIDLSEHMTEICAKPDWASNNGMRFRGQPSPTTEYNTYPALWIETYDGISSKAAVLDAFWVTSPAPDMDEVVLITRTHDSDVSV